MPAQGVLAYESGAWEIDLAQRELRLRGKPVPLGSRAFDIVEVLIASAGELVSKHDLMSRVWPDVTVGDNALQVHVWAVRKALGADRWMLKTTSGRGYRLLGSWTVRHQEATRQPSGLQRITINGEAPAGNFPAAVTRLVGRAAAAQRLRDLISAYRVVTLTGPGGIGKSTLALKAARHVLGDFADGGWLVELAPLSDPGLVPSAVAGVLGLKISGESITAGSVARAIGEQRLLLVLDNCEHVIEAVADLAETLVRLCPGTTIVATSQEVLRIDGEHVYRVPPLEVPDAKAADPGHILAHSAVELFIARIQAQESDYAPRAEDLPSIAAICRRLDGIPLAIEFAAARTATLGMQQVTAGLRDRFTLLIGGRRTALPRHRTLRATLDWSHALLSEPEQVLLRRLAVFPAGFTLDAVVAVTKDTGLDASMVMDNIANLVSKSLVTLDNSDAVTRWSLLETIRAYAREKLAEHAETGSAARHHAIYFRDLIALPASGARSRLSHDDLTWRVREIDNIRAALDWCFSADGDVTIGVHLVAAYAPVLLHLSLIGECRDRCERALTSFQAEPGLDVRLQMELQIALASTLIVTLGPPGQTEAVLTKALGIADAVHDLDAQARALAALSTVYVYYRDYDRARTALERLRQVAGQIGDPGIVAVADRRIGTRLLTAGRLREARQCFEHILEAPMPPEDHRPEFWNYLDARAMARAMLARALCLQGYADQARQDARTSVAEVQATDHPLSICRVLNFGLCRIASMTGHFDEAEQAITHSIEVATRLNAPFWQIVGLFLQGKLLVDRHEFAAGSAVLRDAFDKCGQNGWRISYPEFKGTLAAAYLGLGQTGEALDAVNDAIDNSGPQHGQMWYLPELLRIKGEILLRADGSRLASAGEDCLRQAAAMAREQEALFWELRIALSLARLRMAQSRRKEAMQVLAPVYDRFTEGFETTDMQSASELLRTLRLAD